MTRNLVAIAALCALLPHILGASSCGGAGKGPPKATIRFDFPYWEGVNVGEPLNVHVLVDTNGHRLQAYEMGIKGTITRVALLNVQPHAQFDDDGGFFMPPTYQLFDGKINGIVDLRHGTAAATQSVRIATFQLVPHTAGVARLDFQNVQLANQNGTQFQLTMQSQQFTVSP